jgi:curli biogenesis system outer membrane secretion channel CsgG
MLLSRSQIKSAISIIALISATVHAPASFADEPWKPYLQEKDGKTKAFPEKMSDMKDKEWLHVHYTEYRGMKPRLGVVLSEEKDVAPQYTDEWVRLLSDIYGQSPQGTNPFNHIEDLVREALGGTHRFAMLERTTATDDVLEEQDFGASGRVDSKTAAATGRVKGAEYIVKATIIELNPEKDAKDIQAIGGVLGGSALGIGSVGVSGKVAFCRLNVRIVNAGTMEIVKDMTFDGTASSKGVSLAGLGFGAGSKIMGGAGVASSTKKQAPLSDAMQACANKIAYAVATSFEDLPWRGAVANASGGKIMVNGGSNVGLQTGATLTVLSRGEEILDPESGESLGFNVAEIGVIRVVSVQERFAICEVATGCDGIKNGDIVVLVRDVRE